MSKEKIIYGLYDDDDIILDAVKTIKDKENIKGEFVAVIDRQTSKNQDFELKFREIKNEIKNRKMQ